TRRAAILTADGVGEWATLSLGRGSIGEGGEVEIELLRELRFPHSLGMLYSTFTAYLGFKVNEGEYKVMGLASYGSPAFEPQVRKMVRRAGDGAPVLDLSYFEYHRGARRSFSDRFVAELGPPRDPLDPIDLATSEGKRYADIAASVQRVLEDILVDLARSLRSETGLDDLCLGGGVALNGRANARILRESGFRNAYVPSAPGDAGCAMGAALAADRLPFSRPHRETPDHPYWGPPIDDDVLSRIAREDGLELARAGGDADLAGRVARELARGRIVGWMQGRTEFRPRPLGNPSILAAPPPAAIRERLHPGLQYPEAVR